MGTLKLEIPQEIIDAISTRFGYDQKTKAAKDAQPKIDFVHDKVIEFLKRESGEHVAAESAATAAKNARVTIDAVVIQKVK